MDPLDDFLCFLVWIRVAWGMAQASAPPPQLPSGRSEVVGCGYQSKPRGTGCKANGTTSSKVTIHSYLNRDQANWTEVWLVFRGGLFTQLENDGVLDRARPVLRPGLDQGLIEAFDAIHGISMRGDWREAHGLVAQVHALCTAVERLDQAAGPHADIVARACALLGESLHLALDQHQVAAQLGMGYEAFRKFFVAATGVPPARWRSLKRVELARSLLLRESTSLAAIAERLGYCDEYFFNRQFKRVTGISPARFRRDFAHRR